MVSKDDIFGNRSIIGHLDAGAILAETFVSPVSEKCRLRFCRSSCCLLFLGLSPSHHHVPVGLQSPRRLIENMLFILAKRI
jgi:hypothetical protein